MRASLQLMTAICLLLIGVTSAQAEPLTDDTLKTMLENLGYKVDIAGDKAPRRYKIQESSQDNALEFTITFQLSSANESSILWIYAGLYAVPADTEPPSGALLALLAKNSGIGPMYFSYSPDSRLLYLNAPIANADITPVTLRQQIRSFVGNMDSTYSLWNVKEWK